MNQFAATLRREGRVAFSRHAQAVWFRIVKWTTILPCAALFYDRATFWWCLAGLDIAGTRMHFLHRAQIKYWTQCWGEWNDLDGVRD